MIVSGPASAELARKIAKALGQEAIEAEYKKFPDGETYIRLDKEIKEPAIVVQGLQNPQNDHLAELLFILDLLNQKGVKKIACVIPYYAYARQDKIFKPGELDSARTIAKLLKAFNVSFIITCDLHFQRKEGKFDLFGIPAYNAAASELLVEKAREEYGTVTVITPDLGSTEQAKAVGGKTLSKKRLTSFEVDISGEMEVKGKNVVILDDMVTTGGTMVKALNLAKQKGATKAIAAFTHAAFAGEAREKLKAAADSIITTDTIPSEYSKVSVAAKLAEATKKWKS